MWTRLSKVIALGIYGLFSLLVGLDNLIDYDTNFAFVQHVLAMDTVFRTSQLTWRAIDSAALHHAAYAVIIMTELASGVSCLVGSGRLVGKLRDAQGFDRSKTLGVVGLAIGLALWFFGFYLLGSQWFASWQSELWNSSEVGLRLTALVVLILIFLTRGERDQDV